MIEVPGQTGASTEDMSKRLDRSIDKIPDGPAPRISTLGQLVARGVQSGAVLDRPESSRDARRCSVSPTSEDQRGRKSTGKIARRKQLTVALSSSAAEMGDGRLRSNTGFACSWRGSVRLRELGATLPTRAKLRLKTLMRRR
jgi:hypothetical protein